MSIFKYTLPSGAKFTLTAPEGTTQLQADKVFYEQVAAGTLIGYRTGETLTSVQQKLTSFGLSRLQRGTAGVDDATLLAVIGGLPIVATLPSTLSAVPVINPINSVNFLQVNSNTTQGNFSLGQDPVGPLNETQVQALMGQLAATVDQPADVVTQDKGIGQYGFNCQQLEAAGYVSPGYCDRYCRIDPATQTNPDNFVEVMSVPGAFSGKDGITSIDQVLADQALQNQIQQTLMQQSYDQLVANGVIIPPASETPTPPPSTGQVYNSNGTMTHSSTLSLLAAAGLGAGALSLYNDYKNIFSSDSGLGNIAGALSSDPVGTITDSLKNLGGNAIASFNSAIDSLSSGAIGFADTAKASLSGGLDQLQGIVSGNLTAATSIISAVNSDVGALITNASKYGTTATELWAKGSTALTNLTGDFSGSLKLDTVFSGELNLSSITNSIPSLNSITGSLPSLGNLGSLGDLGSLSSSLTSGMDLLGKASQFGVSFADFSLSGLESSVQPAAGFTGTVNRAQIDAAVNRVIGSEKISAPLFQFPSLASLGLGADLAQAQGILKSIGSRAVNIGGLFG